MKKIFLAICFIIALTGCSNYHEVKQGYVVKMKCIPQHSVPYYNVCLKMTMIRIVPEEYFIWLADSVEVRRIEVRKDRFNSLTLGDYLKLNR